MDWLKYKITRQLLRVMVLFFTGINIRNINNIVLASPSKSKYECSNLSGEGCVHHQVKIPF